MTSYTDNVNFKNGFGRYYFEELRLGNYLRLQYLLNILVSYV
jgi:hypothetical protein